MDPTGGRDSRYNLNYSMSMMSESPEIYGNPNVSLARPPSGGLVGQVMSRGGTGGTGLMTNGPQCGGGGGGGGGTGTGTGGGGMSRGIKRTNSDCYDDRQQQLVGGGQSLTGLDGCTVGSEVVDDGYTSLQPKKSPPSNGKKTKGRVKIKMEYIDNKLRRYTTFSKRKTGIMKKAYELSTLTGTQVMLLVASETGHVYTFATRKLQPMITSEAGKALIQTCLNSPDPPTGSSGDQRMSATGFEETELSYNIGDEDSKDDRSPMSSGSESDDYSPPDSPPPGPRASSSSNHNANSSHSQPGSSGEKAAGRTVAPQPSASNVSSTISSTTGTSPTTGTLTATISAIQQQIQQQQQALQQQIQHRHQLQQQKQSPKPAKGKASAVKVKQEPPGTSVVSTAPPTSTANAASTTTGAPQITSNILYPASALSSLPQEVLINLLQSGQLQLHSEGGTQQYVTFPVPLMGGKANAKSSNANGQSKGSSSANSSPSASSNSSTSQSFPTAPSRSGSSRRNTATSTIKTEVFD